jgi:hypothetical protein
MPVSAIAAERAASIGILAATAHYTGFTYKKIVSLPVLGARIL